MMPMTLNSKNDRQSHRDRLAGHRSQPSEVGQNDDRDEGPQDHQEFALSDQIGFAGFVDQVGNVAHGFMDRHFLELKADRQPEQQAEGAEDQADGQQLVAVHAEKADGREIRKLQVGFAPGSLAGLSESGGSIQHKQGKRGGKKLRRVVPWYERQPPHYGKPGVHMIPPMGPRRLQTSSAHEMTVRFFTLPRYPADIVS